MKTEDLIQKLSSNLPTVKRIYPVSITLIGWILFSFLSIFFFVWDRSENFQFIHIPKYSYELIPVILAVISSLFLAIYSSIPGNRIKKKFTFLPISFLLLWSLSLIVRYLLLSSNTDEAKYLYHACSKDILFMSLPSTAVLLYIINRRIPILKNWIGFWILAASASVSVIGASFLCPNENPSHLLILHFLPVIALCLFGVFLGTFLFREV